MGVKRSLHAMGARRIAALKLKMGGPFGIGFMALSEFLIAGRGNGTAVARFLVSSLVMHV